MSGVKYFTDEDVYAAVAPALRKAGGDAVPRTVDAMASRVNSPV